MDKIFGHSIIEQDSILCKIQPEILKIISEYLPPNDVVHLSQTCKELHQKPPFYLKKSGTFTFIASSKTCSWFQVPTSNISISEIDISFTEVLLGISIYHWVQIIRKEKVVLETEEYFIKDTGKDYQIKIKDITLKEYKGGGDKVRFMA